MLSAWKEQTPGEQGNKPSDDPQSHVGLGILISVLNPYFLFPVPCFLYSSRNNCAGFTPSARRAGIQEAIAPIRTMAAAAPASTSGSRGVAS
jgi:hypothetical protein